MNSFSAAAVINVAIIGLAGYVFWLTRSPWSFLILVFLVSAKVRE